MPYRLWQKVLKSEGADVICLQEDLVKTNLALTEWLSDIGEKYYLANQCLSHNVDGGDVGKILSNSIYVRDNVSVDHSKDESFSNVENISDYRASQRCATYAIVKGLVIANVHLTGGRFDDINAAILGRVKQTQLWKIVKHTSPDIILGDFNGDNAVNMQLNSYDPYLNDPDVFGRYWTAGHKFLVDQGYIRVPFDGPTTIFGTRSDHVYYKIGKIKSVKSQKIVMYTAYGDKSMKYSDHNGLFVTFEIDTDRQELCDSLMSYDCIIFESGFSHITLKENSLLYRYPASVPGDVARFFSGTKTASVYMKDKTIKPIKYRVTKKP